MKATWPKMCGRFTQAYTWQELADLYRLAAPPIHLQRRYNIAPTAAIDVVVAGGGGQFELVRMRWGLIPSWWGNSAEELPATFNARAETVASKPMFRAAFERNRCVIPASGYYEWKPTRNGKQPYYISARDGAILSFAGLWDEWHDIEIGETIRSCAIIVTGANALTRPVHEQMPAVLKRFEPWLAGIAGAEVLKPAPEDMLQMWPVSRRVNRVGHDADRTLIEAVQ